VRVLVVDDDQATTELLSRFLSSEGFEVVTALDALQATAILDGELVQAVVTDLTMPRFGGRELVRRIRSDPRVCHIPVILITAFFDDDTIDTVLREGASLFLPKPLDLHMLSTLLKFSEQ
jgi:CheY-like chemotaxis protein